MLTIIIGNISIFLHSWCNRTHKRSTKDEEKISNGDKYSRHQITPTEISFRFPPFIITQTGLKFYNGSKKSTKRNSGGILRGINRRITCCLQVCKKNKKGKNRVAKAEGHDGTKHTQTQTQAHAHIYTYKQTDRH
jgi:hypothetical protein